MHHFQIINILFFYLIAIRSQLNFYYTDHPWRNACLRITAYFGKTMHEYQKIEYCFDIIPSSTVIIDETNIKSQWTFAELSQKNITSEDLFHWSAPIDLIERYQFYLEHSSTNDLFYNCTQRKFGPFCQYEFLFTYLSNFSLVNYIRDFQDMFRFESKSFTCYIHLPCHRGTSPACLDWSEICDGKIDCMDTGIDERDCWQIEIKECDRENEYRCLNGQCIPKSFDRDHSVIVDCLDGSDEPMSYLGVPGRCHRYEQPILGCDEITCKHTYFTSSCVDGRENMLIKSMYLTRGENLSDTCWLAWKCLIESEEKLKKKCRETVQQICPEYFFFPSIPGLRGEIDFVYKTDQLDQSMAFPPILFYLCYTKSSYNETFRNKTKTFIDGRTCISSKEYHPSHQVFIINWKYEYDNVIYRLFKDLQRYHIPYQYNSSICRHSSMYQCRQSSKCISIDRLKDSNSDCPQRDDENISMNLFGRLNQSRYRCSSSGEWIHLALRDNLLCDCYSKDSQHDCEDESSSYDQVNIEISFAAICDGFDDLHMEIIDGQNENDETNCEQWPCHHLYTHCDDLWNCPRGLDEAGCLTYPTAHCSSQEHPCISPISNQLRCLPLSQANDGYIDCLGGTDEPRQCEGILRAHHSYGFACNDPNESSCIPKRFICNGVKDCEHADDEQICTRNQSDVEVFLNHYLQARLKHRKYLAFNPMSEIFTTTIIPFPPMIHLTDASYPRCHRGLDIDVRLNDDEVAVVCLCPPSFYGDRCQYQNERVSLAIRFRALSNSWQTIFAIVVSLIEQGNERRVHSYEQLTYLAMRDCKVKFNIYLVYATRPKNISKNYAIHLDIYDKFSLTYRASLFYPIPFTFLPVHRLPLMIDIPTDIHHLQKCSYDRCLHGKCFRYANHRRFRSFCQCDSGWSGRYCSIPHSCSCSLDSLCHGISANNQSICVCPLNKFGPRCLLPRTVCRTGNDSTCKNGGQCVADDDLMSNRTFICICRKGYRGDRCELVDNQVILSFHDEIRFSQSIFIHFIQSIDMHTPPIRATTFKTIPIRQDSVVVYWSRPFHLVFIELSDKTYYLAVFQTTYNGSIIIRKTINPSDRCRSIDEVLNSTIVRWPLLRRIKYYHLPCQTYSSDLKCFYDDVHLCLCYDFDRQRLANCFDFNHNMTFDCLGQSECENGAHCLQDHPECPTSSLCMCPPCFYGRRCQFTSNGFGLSLDAILGYHILPHRSFHEQPLIIKMSLVGTIVFLTIGFINSILSFITFKNKHVREVGCGLYLLSSSITTLLTMSIFGLKFIILVLTQMTLIKNRTFLLFQCHSMDFLLRTCLCMDQWLSACVAIERAITAVQGTRFDKRKSKQTAKLIITTLVFVVIATAIHDPIYRRLIDERNNDDDNLQRIWCTVSYSSGLQVYNNIIYISHFCGAFIVNLVSVIILIRMKSRHDATIHPQMTQRDRLQGQLRQHKHLLTAPIVLVILALPRLIISFVSKCMQSANDSWIFLVGYFISLIPSMLTFVVFVLPSRFYRNQFRRTVQRLRRKLQRRLQRIR